MSSSNRVSLRYCEEESFGQTQSNPVFQTVRRVGLPAFKFSPKTVKSDEVRSDRQIADNIFLSKETSGDVDVELSFQTYDELIAGAMFSNWVSFPKLYNETSDGTITNVANSGSTFTVASGGAAFKAGHLVKASGFTNSGNNGVFKVTSSTGTTVVVSGTLTNESVPPEGATLKVVGFMGASGDIDATSSGISSTSLDFTTIGLVSGMWLKVGGSASGSKFLTSDNNNYIRIDTVSAHSITFDYLPDGWESETGTDLTLKFWAGDYLRNGTVKKSFAFEMTNEDHSPETYQVFNGMVVNGLSFDIKSESKITGKISMLGTNGTISNTRTSGATSVDPTDSFIFNSSSNIGIVYLGNEQATLYIDSMTLDINNNINRVGAISYDYSVALNEGDFDTTGEMSAFFVDKSQYQKILNNEESSFGFSLKDNDGQAYVFDQPRVKYNSFDLSDNNNTVIQKIGTICLLSDKGYMTHIQRMYHVE